MKKTDKNQSIQKTIDQLVRHYRIPYNSSKEDALNTIFSKIDQNKKSAYSSGRKTVSLRIVSVSAAAVAALVVAIYLFTATVNFSADQGKSASFRLPDHSRVVIEKDSQLSLKKYLWNRNVKLEGAAYFEVEKGSKFTVKTNTGSVEVLGTRFYVCESGQKMTVQCFAGKVKTQVGENSYLLTPGNQVENVTAKVKAEIEPLKSNFPEVAIFHGSYQATSLNKIISELNSFFGVNITTKIKTNPKFTGTVETGKVENALEIVCTSLKLEYRTVDNNTILIYK